MANADPPSGGRGREVSKVLLRVRRRVSYDLAVLSYIYIYLYVYISSLLSYRILIRINSLILLLYS